MFGKQASRAGKQTHSADGRGPPASSKKKKSKIDIAGREKSRSGQLLYLKEDATTLSR
jgi:hypothetical protein